MTTDLREKRCGNCEWWVAIEPNCKCTWSSYGKCHGAPPTQMPQFGGSFPVTEAQHYCRVHEPKVGDNQ